MRVWVDGVPVDLLPGMSVRHALLRAGRLAEVEGGAGVRDEWGNEVGLDGGLAEGARLVVERPSPTSR